MFNSAGLTNYTEFSYGDCFPPARRICLILGLAEANGVFAGESVVRRLDRLAQMLGLEAETERR